MNRNNNARNPRQQFVRNGRQQQHRALPADELKEIKATYNFVPLSQWVHTPAWAPQVSHDLPFRDGISGTIEYTLTAHTPLLVGNQQSREKGKLGQVHPFRTPDGYAIPGSSVKGMARSVMEIATFARMTQVDDKALSIRDLKQPFYLKRMNGEQRAGWLTADESGWKISPCHYARIDHDQLAELSGDKWWNEVPQGPASDKYNKWTSKSNQRHPSLDISFTPEILELSRGVTHISRARANELGHGNIQGHLVFTGQPTTRTRTNRKTKHKEFIFWQHPDAADISVPDVVMRRFHEVQEKTKNNKPSAWEWWKRKGERIPVFYLVAEEQIESLGLALMYRLPYKTTIGDAIATITKEHLQQVGPGKMSLPDFTTTLFGCTDPEFGESLKGRISFSLATATLGATELERKRVVLNGPKPSFFPNYITQSTDSSSGRLSGKTYATLMDPGATIRGWKRYPARNELTASTEGTDAVASELHLLPANTTFRGRIRLHNVRPEELGALLWVLTWGKDDRLRHGIGMGKSLGYGQMSITVEGGDLCTNDGRAVDMNEAMRSFVTHMEDAYGQAFGGGSWADSNQIRALLAMAAPGNSLPIGNLILGQGRDNQFVAAKKASLVLKAPVPLRAETLTAKGGAAPAPGSNAPAEPIAWPPLGVQYDKGRPELRIVHDGKTAFAQGPEAIQMVSALTETQRKRLEKGKLKAIAHVIEAGGRNMRIVQLLAEDPA